jgi:hypothetical protein
MLPPPFKGKSTNNNLLVIQETLLPLLMVIPYDQLNGVHFLMAILMEAIKYKANHGNTKFRCPTRLPFYDKTITNNAMAVIQIHTEAAHKSCLNDYTSYKVAKRGVS